MKNFLLALVFTLGLSQAQMMHIERHWYDPEKNLVTIQIDPILASGSDGACFYAGEIFHRICKQGYNLMVLPPAGYVGGFVPSQVNPMTVEWTRYLVGNQDRDE